MLEICNFAVSSAVAEVDAGGPPVVDAGPGPSARGKKKPGSIALNRLFFRGRIIDRLVKFIA